MKIYQVIEVFSIIKNSSRFFIKICPLSENSVNCLAISPFFLLLNGKKCTILQDYIDIEINNLEPQKRNSTYGLIRPPPLSPHPHAGEHPARAMSERVNKNNTDTSCLLLPRISKCQYYPYFVSLA